MTNQQASGPASGRRKSAVPKRLVVVVAIAAVAVGAWYFALYRDTRDDLGKLQGDWNYSAAARANAGVIRVEGTTWSYHSGGPFGRSYRISLLPEANPKEIDLALLTADGQPATFTHGAGKGSEVKLLGIYEIHGNEVNLALSPERRPNRFDDDEAQLLTLTR
ncbi:MAG TPA: hypothetical protein VGI99_09635 [Gemmataceae bacterium]|jgi:uncharacterized protein (TIGR03067 family)